MTLANLPADKGAIQGLKQIGELEAVDEKMRELIEAGDRAYASGDYGQALDRDKDAKNQTEKARILKHHVSLEQKINQTLDLRSWQTRIQEVLASAKLLQKQGNLAQAVGELQRLQAELPEDQVFVDMAQEATQLVAQIRQGINADEILSEATKRFREEDYEGAIELASTSTLAGNEEADRLIKRSQDRLDRHIFPALDNAEKALGKGDWQDAFAELDKLREKYPDNPELETPMAARGVKRRRTGHG